MHHSFNIHVFQSYSAKGGKGTFAGAKTLSFHGVSGLGIRPSPTSFVRLFTGRFADEVQSQYVVLSEQKPWWFSEFGHLDENVAHAAIG